MIVETTTFDFLLAAAAMGIKPTPIHRYKDKIFLLASIGKTTYLIVSEEGPTEPFVEYNLRTREWISVDPKVSEFSGDPNTVVVPIMDAKDLNGEVGVKIKKLLE